MMINQTAEKLRALRLPVMAAEYLRQSKSPTMSALDLDERVGMIVDAEWTARQNNRIDKLTKSANLRFPGACFADVDYRATRKLEKSTIARLSNFVWVKEARNIIITGATGCGKTWLACAFGAEACRVGLSCAYYRTSRLLNEMAQASSTGSLNKWLAKIKKTDILILDDWGLSTVNPLESLFLYEAFEERCGERSTILTAQVPVSKWHDLFEDPTKADAVLDRITHNAYRITLQGHSLRADTANLMSKEPSENEPMATEEGDGVV